MLVTTAQAVIPIREIAVISIREIAVIPIREIAVIPIRENDDKINALILLVVLFL
jgi:hypothetical protein